MRLNSLSHSFQPNGHTIFQYLVRNFIIFYPSDDISIPVELSRMTVCSRAMCRSKESEYRLKFFFTAHAPPAGGAGDCSTCNTFETWRGLHMVLQMLKNLSHLRKYRWLWPFLNMASVFLVQSSLLSMWTPRYLFSSTMSTYVPLMEMGFGRVLCFLKSTTNSFIFVTLSCRWFSPLHSTNLSTTLLYSASWPLWTQSTMAELSENFCRWQDSKHKLKSEV